MPDYQPFPVRSTVVGTVLDGTSIVTEFLAALVRARLRYEQAGMLDTPAPPDVEKLLDRLVDAQADLDLLDPDQPGDRAERQEILVEAAHLMTAIVSAASEGEPGWSVHIGDHDRQLAADLLLAADDSDDLKRQREAANTCEDCGHLMRSRHITTEDGRTVCVELLADPDGSLSANDCHCDRPALRLVTGQVS